MAGDQSASSIHLANSAELSTPASRTRTSTIVVVGWPFDQCPSAHDGSHRKSLPAPSVGHNDLQIASSLMHPSLNHGSQPYSFLFVTCSLQIFSTTCSIQVYHPSRDYGFTPGEIRLPHTLHAMLENNEWISGWGGIPQLSSTLSTSCTNATHTLSWKCPGSKPTTSPFLDYRVRALGLITLKGQSTQNTSQLYRQPSQGWIFNQIDSLQ